MPTFNQSTTSISTGLVAYVKQILGVEINLAPWLAASTLQPAFQELYAFFATSLLGNPCVLVIEKGSDAIAYKNAHKHLLSFAEKHDEIFIFVAETVTSTDRKRLIDNGVQFIIPGSQLFVPAIGADLRERFRKRLQKVEFMKPASQAMLIRQICSPWGTAGLQMSDTSLGHMLGKSEIDIDDIGSGTDYSRMTVNRAVRELQSLGLITVEKAPAVKNFVPHPQVHIAVTASTLWKKARTHMRSPVKRMVWLDEIPSVPKDKMLVAGESALMMLSKSTAVSEPAVPVFAIGQDLYKNLDNDGLINEVDESDAACCVQVWSYDPMEIYRWSPCVDLYSLSLSFQGNDDQRIQTCLDELCKQIS